MTDGNKAGLYLLGALGSGTAVYLVSKANVSEKTAGTVQLAAIVTGLFCASGAAFYGLSAAVQPSTVGGQLESAKMLG